MMCYRCFEEVGVAFIGIGLVLLIAMTSARAEAQELPAGLTGEDWQACLRYQAKVEEQTALISRLSVQIEKEKHTASSCAGALQTLNAQLIKSEKPVAKEDSRPVWVTVLVAGASGAAVASGLFLLSDYPGPGGALAGVGAAGLVLSILF